MNFAIEPERLPFVLAKPFRTLEELLGHGALPADSGCAAYEHHLGFAREIENRLDLRDMLDAQSVIVDAARNSAFWEEPASATPSTRAEPDVYLSVCAIYRDEAAYLREWIEFHRLVGVERFFLYDNRSVDDHREVLAPYVERGSSALHDWPMAQGQLPAYEHCIAEHGPESRWIAFIDLDEFLFSPTGQPLPEVLADYEQWPAVGVNWAVYGPSGPRREAERAGGRELPRTPATWPPTRRSRASSTRPVSRAAPVCTGSSTTGLAPSTRTTIRSSAARPSRCPSSGCGSTTTSRSPSRSTGCARAGGARIPRWWSASSTPAVLERWEQGAEHDEVITQYLPALRERLALSS